MGRGGLSLGSLIVIGIVCLVLGINPLTLLSEGGGIEIPNMPRPERRGCAPRRNRACPVSLGWGSGEDEKARFVRYVLADTEDVWEKLFAGRRPALRKAHACSVPRRHAHRMRHRSVGHGAVLLPGRPKVYIDLSFYEELA